MVHARHNSKFMDPIKKTALLVEQHTKSFLCISQCPPLQQFILFYIDFQGKRRIKYQIMNFL